MTTSFWLPIVSSLCSLLRTTTTRLSPCSTNLNSVTQERKQIVIHCHHKLHLIFPRNLHINCTSILSPITSQALLLSFLQLTNHTQYLAFLIMFNPCSTHALLRVVDAKRRRGDLPWPSFWASFPFRLTYP